MAGYGYFQDEHGDKSSSRLMSFIALMAILAWASAEVWRNKGIPELHWGWLALPIGIYLIGKVGQAAADAVLLSITGRMTETKPEVKP